MSRTIGRIMGPLRTLLASRTWRLRGAAAIVIVVLVGGWAVGVVGLGGAETATDQAGATTPSENPSESATDTPTPEELDASQLVGSSSAPTEGTPSPSGSAPEDGGVEPIAETGGDRPEQSDPPRTRTPDPTPTRTPQPSPTPKPTPKPSESADCADPAQALDCLLAPITSRP